MVGDIVSLFSKDGVLFLAGLLNEQQAEVEGAYTALGMCLKAVHGNDPEWPVLDLFTHWF